MVRSEGIRNRISQRLRVPEKGHQQRHKYLKLKALESHIVSSLRII